MSISLFKKCSLLFLCVFTSCVFTTQTQNDSISPSSELDTIAYKKSLLGKSLHQLANTLFDQMDDADSLRAEIAAKYIEESYLKSNNLKEKSGAYITLALWESEKDNIKKSLLLLERGISISSKIQNDSILYLGLVRKGVRQYKLANHEQALSAYYRALEIAKKNKNERREVIVTNNIALVRMQANDTKAALELLLQNYKKIKEKPSLINVESKLSLYVNICGVYIDIEDYDAAKRYCDEGRVFSMGMKDTSSVAHFLSAFAEIARHHKDFEECHRLLDESEVLMGKKLGNENLNLFLKFYRAKAYYDEGKFQLAVDELLKIEEMKVDYDVEILSIQEMYYYLAKSYKELGNIEEAIKYYDEAEEINNRNDKIRDELNTNLIKKFDLVNLKEEIIELKQESKQTKFYYVGGITLLIIIIIGLLMFNKKQQQKNRRRFEVLMSELEEKRQKAERAEVSNNIEQLSIKKENTKQSKEVLKSKPDKIDPKMAAILKRLDEFEEKELFLSKDSTLVEVAKKIQTNTTYLSKVINTHKEKSFTSYITDLRVDYAIERLSHDRKFRSFTIGAIAQEIGFKRSESFSKAFKVKTGLYPSYFIKELEKQINSMSE